MRATTYPLARCWGGPLDGQIVPADSPFKLGLAYDEPEWRADRLDAWRPEGPRYRQVTYRAEKIAVRLLAPPDHVDDLTEITEHYDLPGNRRTWIAVWRCYIPETDSGSRILAGLRLAAWLTSPG